MLVKRSVLLVALVSLVLAWKGWGPAKPLNQRIAEFPGQRCLVLVSTDKEIYRPGETVHIRGVLLDAFNRTPCVAPAEDDFRTLHGSIKNPSGEEVWSASAIAEVGSAVGSLSWTIPSEISGGDFKLEIAGIGRLGEGIAPGTRSFNIRAFRTPKLNLVLELMKNAYAPGERVSALSKASKVEGGLCSGADTTFTAVDSCGELLASHRGKSDASGGAQFSFLLPADLLPVCSDVVLSLTVQKDGITESTAVTVPVIRPGRLEVSFIPESTPMIIPGVSRQRIYLQALQDGNPVDIVGFIRDLKTSKSLQLVATSHEGRAEFTLENVAIDSAYELVIDTPAGQPPIPLPPVGSPGLSFTAQGSFKWGEDIILNAELSSHAEPTKISFGLFQREKELSILNITLLPGEAKRISLSPGASYGVLRITASSGNGSQAERLFFRHPPSSLAIHIEPDSLVHSPGDSVSVAFTVVDKESGLAIPGAVLSVCVTDAAVKNLVSLRKRAPSIAAMALLEGEVAFLNDPESYLSPDGQRKLDLLLGVQEWRRFAYSKPLEQFQGGNFRSVLAFNPSSDWMHMAPRFAGAVPDFDRNVMLLLEVADDGRAIMPMAKAVVTEGRGGLGFSYSPPTDNGERTDFTETILWIPALRTDTKGRATASFYLSHSLTSFSISADAFDSNGAVGSGQSLIQSRLPFYIAPVVPLAVSTGDVTNIPVAIFNSWKEPLLLQVNVDSDDLGLTPFSRVDKVPGGETALMRIPIRIGDIKEGVYSIRFSAYGKNSYGNWSDIVKRSFRVDRRGFPSVIDQAGVVGPSGTVWNFKIPEIGVDLYSNLSIKLYATPAARLNQALEALIREPYGCFEQTSSVTYPAVMALQYFLSHPQGGSQEEKLIQRAREVVESGYKRLTSYECKDGGFEWFGTSPAHEALTAYGLLEFYDMKKVFPVDSALLERTEKWLISRKLSDRFARNARSLDSFGSAPDEITDAYIVWSLTFAGRNEGLEQPIERLVKLSETRKDGYFLGLVAGILYNIGDRARADQIASRLVQSPDGQVVDSITSITMSCGQPLNIEATSISILAWLSSGEEKFRPNIERAIAWLSTQCADGKFGSTQGTVLALKAIILYDTRLAKNAKEFSGSISVNGKKLDQTVSFSPEKSAAGTPLEFEVSKDLLVRGENTVQLMLTFPDGNEPAVQIPFSSHLDYYAHVPASVSNPPVTMEVKLRKSTEEESIWVPISVKVTNTLSEGQGMVVAIVGLPGGLEAREERLRELVESGQVAFYETRGSREVVFYWRSMGPHEIKEFTFDAGTHLPGTYTGPASRVYPYYNDPLKHWVDPLQITITPRS